MVKEMRGEKAPGPNDFTMAFFHACSDVVKGNIIAIIDEFWREGRA